MKVKEYSYRVTLQIWANRGQDFDAVIKFATNYATRQDVLNTLRNSSNTFMYLTLGAIMPRKRIQDYLQGLANSVKASAHVEDVSIGVRATGYELTFSGEATAQ